MRAELTSKYYSNHWTNISYEAYLFLGFHKIYLNILDKTKVFRSISQIFQETSLSSGCNSERNTLCSYIAKKRLHQCMKK